MAALRLLRWAPPLAGERRAACPMRESRGGEARIRVAFRLLFSAGMATITAACPFDPVGSGSSGYHGAVSEFKRRLIEATLHQMRGNRTHTARALGLQRTYLLRLIRDLHVAAPPPPPRRIVRAS
jgi:DNA-binding NtrC family response regulator